ncbi:pectin lyase precursor [Fusarium mundagurra]|uniref:Pectin lyase n=1 Tax=Fusarium mundagurra TaxID=1567541 RepID=A0A8H6DD08_9HYPO|nr:pectin lyase precursor [Fusarium mundagurra]
MRFLDVFVAVVVFLPTSFAALPTQAEGFASSTTGGKGGQVVRPRSHPGSPRIKLVHYKFEGTIICAPKPESTWLKIISATTSGGVTASFSVPFATVSAVMSILIQERCTTL